MRLGLSRRAGELSNEFNYAGLDMAGRPLGCRLAKDQTESILFVSEIELNWWCRDVFRSILLGQLGRRSRVDGRQRSDEPRVWV